MAAMRTTARRADGGYVIDGEKTWISNAGIADLYVVFCRLPERASVAIAAFMRGRGEPGPSALPSASSTIAPHPLGTIALEAMPRAGRARSSASRAADCRVALGTLDVFRATVGAAALGFARRALDEALAHVRSRQAFGGRWPIFS